LIHFQRFGIARPASDYRPPRANRMVVPWRLHPKATRSTQLTASDLTPHMPHIGNQDRIGACNSYGTKDAIATSLSAAQRPVPGYFAALPLYRAVRCLERAASTWLGDELPPLTDCGADPDDVLRVAQQFGMQTSAQECDQEGPSQTLSQYEDQHVNDEPTLGEFEHDSTFKVVGGFDIVSTGQQRLLDVSNALASGYAVGISVAASDDRYQQYDGGILADPPAGAELDHYNYLAGLDMSTSSPLFVGVNSWDIPWGIAWGSAPGGCWKSGPAIIQASDRLVVYSVQGVTL
jgi:hypothetical protein